MGAGNLGMARITIPRPARMAIVTMAAIWVMAARLTMINTAPEANPGRRRIGPPKTRARKGLNRKSYDHENIFRYFDCRSYGQRGSRRSLDEQASTVVPRGKRSEEQREGKGCVSTY